ncbi:hypothetical protein VE03_10520 [Pseudogymnoascus sp. 23342-1-I1]|nr:hypothetical protein VE03_10520 [Pseudogymnoascus sp. 23342-1-I1]
MASQQIHVDSLEVALNNFLEILHNNGEDSLRAWCSLQSSYDKADKGKEPFTLWCLQNIDVDTIKNVSRLLYAAHFKSLRTLKLKGLLKLTEEFQTSKWIIYFVLGEHTIGHSTKLLYHILCFKSTHKDLTLAMLVAGLENARSQRLKSPSRSLSNDPTRFTLSDAKSAFQVPVHRLAAPRKVRHQELPSATPHQSRSSPTPPYSSDEDMGNHDDYNSSDVELPRERAVPLDDYSSDLDNITGIKEPVTAARHVRRRLRFSSDDDEGLFLNGASDLDSDPVPVDEPGEPSQHPTKPWRNPEKLLRSHPGAVPEPRYLCDLGDRGSPEQASDVEETAPTTKITPMPNVKEKDLGDRGARGSTQVEPSYKRQYMMAKTVNVASITLSPQLIVEAVMTVRQLSQLGPVLLSSECQQQDPVDSTIWNLFKSYISIPTAESGPAVPTDIIKSLGFPCVSRLPEAFHIDATASAYMLKELIRRSRDSVKMLQFEFEADLERLKVQVQVVPASSTRTYILDKAQQEMSLLVRSLEGLFEGAQDSVARLREYGQAVQHAQKRFS